MGNDEINEIIQIDPWDLYNGIILWGERNNGLLLYQSSLLEFHKHIGFSASTIMDLKALHTLIKVFYELFMEIESGKFISSQDVINFLEDSIKNRKVIMADINMRESIMSSISETMEESMKSNKYFLAYWKKSLKQEIQNLITIGNPSQELIDLVERINKLLNSKKKITHNIEPKKDCFSSGKPDPTADDSMG